MGKTFVQIAASVLLHGSIVGAVLAFSSDYSTPDERTYRVTLVGFSASVLPAAPPAPPSPPPEPPKSEPAAGPPRPEPVTQKPPEPKTRKISTKKTTEKKRAVEETQQAAPLPPSAPVQIALAGPAGPTMTIGGLAAYNVDAVDQRPAIAKRVLPEYPQKARRMSVQGKVFVRLVVDTVGQPKECKIHQADPAGYFEDAALSAARKTRFIPGKVKGQPVNTVVLVPFVFALR